MSYSVSSITSLNDIPALVKTFADTLGFTTSTVSATSITVKHPTYTGALVFTVAVANTGSGATLRERLAITCSAAGSTPAWCESPKLNKTQGNTTAAVSIEQPTKLHLFGMKNGSSSDSGKTYIAGVVEYGFNLYRHFYLGYAEKITAYDGGEIVTGSAQWPVNIDGGTSQSLTFDSPAASTTVCQAYPFSAANTSNETNISNGGMYINHAGNAQPWRKFFDAYVWGATFDAAFATAGDKIVMGGFRDCVNGGYMAAGKSAYSGAQVLSPINLLIGKRISSVQYFQAVGRPSGARLVHMEDLDPGSEISIGSAKWRVFPVFSKQSADTITKLSSVSLTNTGFPPSNTSQYVGMAYQVSD